MKEMMLEVGWIFRHIAGAIFTGFLGDARVSELSEALKLCLSKGTFGKKLLENFQANSGK